jgi:hypothetical protein
MERKNITIDQFPIDNTKLISRKKSQDSNRIHYPVRLETCPISPRHFLLD